MQHPQKVFGTSSNIALHTTLNIPQRKQPEVALLQLGAGIDIGAFPRTTLAPETVEAILAEYPRLGFKMAMLNAMVQIARLKPMTGIINLADEVGREQEHLISPGFVMWSIVRALQSKTYECPTNAITFLQAAIAHYVIISEC